MKRRHVGLLVLLVLGILPALHTSQALAGRIPVIGILMPTSAEVAAPALQAFRQALGTLGYQDGQTVVFEPRFADGAYERLPALAAELVQLRVDVLLAGSPAMIRAATQATSTIPIVGIGVRTGLFARLTQQGANLTGVRLHLVEVHGPQDFERAIATARTEQADALIVPASGLFVNEPELVILGSHSTETEEVIRGSESDPTLISGVLTFELKEGVTEEHATHLANRMTDMLSHLMYTPL